VRLEFDFFVQVKEEDGLAFHRKKTTTAYTAIFSSSFLWTE